jgi:hypothetical protein
VDTKVELHSMYADGSRLADLPWPTSYAEPPFPQVLALTFEHAWPRCLDLLGDRIDDHIRDLGDRFEGLVQWFMDEAAAPPHAFCHGTSGSTTCSSG